jgi:uncharacterized membrane protein YjjP (DUF1212 family)
MENLRLKAISWLVVFASGLLIIGLCLMWFGPWVTLAFLTFTFVIDSLLLLNSVAWEEGDMQHVED